ncbi:MAG: alpha/beta fold hydrolase [Ignavibacteriales bacterium]|nr:alpha/beta fold hydrolase [Ignavibacteriales bacterium]
MLNSKVIFIFLLLFSFSSKIFAQTQIIGHWEGAIIIMGSDLGIKIDFKEIDKEIKGTIDIPIQNAFGLPLINIDTKIPMIHFDLQGGPGLASFDGKIMSDSIVGDFSQAGMKGTFYLHKGISSNTAVPPEPPPPYAEEEVKIESGKITLAGTLSVPNSAGPHPAVIMITGSGAQNRDEEIFGFKPFKIIADYLTRIGIAVLRCDDRGIGGSTGSMENATGEDLAKDVESQLKYLLNRKEIDQKKIGLLGHSEGGIIAPFVASRSKDIAFMVLVAAPSVSGDKIILKQIELLSRAGGATDSDINQALELQKQVYKVVRENKGWDELRTAISNDAKESLKKLSPEELKSISDPDKLIKTSTDAKINGAKSEWFKYFIDFDPSKYLGKINCPVLALFGELDMQVPPDLNKDPLESALKKSGTKDYSINTLPKANHLFQEAITGNPSEYGSMKKQFVTGFLEKVADWIKNRSAKNNKVNESEN